MQQQLKQLAAQYIDQHQQDFIQYADDLFAMPELGYRESKTRAYLLEALQRLGLPAPTGYGVTGLKTHMAGRSTKYRVSLIGEMDAVPCSAHPQCDATTGAAHACGHALQTALLLSAAQVFSATGLYRELDGDIVFFAVPAEEYIDLPYRLELVQQGVIQHIGGKQQLIAEGAFADIDIAMMLHAQPQTPQPALFLDGGSMGFVSKEVEFFGKATHAANPADGINALNAANLALSAINANRETFRDEDRVRVHPIMTKGGSNINSVPDYARLELYVRAATSDVLQRISQVVDNCVHGAALAIGASARVRTLPGYLPLRQDSALSDLFGRNCMLADADTQVFHKVPMIGSTDMGDLSHLLPCIQPTLGGFSGAAHSSDFACTDMSFALVTALKATVFTLIDLLSDGAVQAQDICNHFNPHFTVPDYLRHLATTKQEQSFCYGPELT